MDEYYNVKNQINYPNMDLKALFQNYSHLYVILMI